MFAKQATEDETLSDYRKSMMRLPVFILLHNLVTSALFFHFRASLTDNGDSLARIFDNIHFLAWPSERGLVRPLMGCSFFSVGRF